MTTYNLELILIVLILLTYCSRLLFFLYTPEIMNKEILISGLRGISPAILIGFVVPFALFEDQRLVFSNILVSLVIAFVVVVKAKKPSLGIVITFIGYFVLTEITRLI